RRRPAAVEGEESPLAAEAPAPAESIAAETAAPNDTSTTDELADEFEAAARLFALTGENPVQQPAAEPVAPATRPVTRGLPVDATPQRRSGRRVAAASFSVGVMGLVGLLTVGMTMPVS
ncbi:hypothetical protein AB0067_26900, partial [Klebsiella pneumoniae]